MAEITIPFGRTVFLPDGSPPMGRVEQVRIDLPHLEHGSEGGYIWCRGEADILIDYQAGAGDMGGAPFSHMPEQAGRSWQALLTLPLELTAPGSLPETAQKPLLMDFHWQLASPRAVELEGVLSLSWEDELSPQTGPEPEPEPEQPPPELGPEQPPPEEKWGYILRPKTAPAAQKSKGDGGWTMVSLKEQELPGAGIDDKLRQLSQEAERTVAEANALWEKFDRLHQASAAASGLEAEPPGPPPDEEWPSGEGEAEAHREEARAAEQSPAAGPDLAPQPEPEPQPELAPEPEPELEPEPEREPERERGPLLKLTFGPPAAQPEPTEAPAPAEAPSPAEASSEAPEEAPAPSAQDSAPAIEGAAESPARSLEEAPLPAPALEKPAVAAPPPPVPEPEPQPPHIWTREPGVIEPEVLEAEAEVLEPEPEVLEPEVLEPEVTEPREKKPHRRRAAGLPRLVVDAKDNKVEISAFNLQIKL